MKTNWFNCSVKYERNAEDGRISVVTENYLVDALSFTEAEERITKEMEPFISGDFLVTKVNRAHIAEMFINNDYKDSGDKFYRCKINFVIYNEEKNIEKRQSVTMYAQATTAKEAIEVIEKGMKDTMADYEIHTVTETNIMDVFEYKE